MSILGSTSDGLPAAPEAPIDPVLLARINAALRQHDQSEDAVFTIGQYSFQPAAKLLETNDGIKVRLTDKETSILKYLYRQGPKTITRDVLLNKILPTTIA